MRSWTFAAALLVASGLAHAESINVDELPHNIIQLPNGARAEVILFHGVNFRSVGPEILTGNNDSDPDICFEAKYDSIQGDKVKLFGLQGTLLVEDRELLRSSSEFKRADNVWFCGSLHKTKDGKGVELVVSDMQKQLPDLERYSKRIQRFEKRFNDAAMTREERLVIAESAIDLGHRIDQDMKQTINNFGDYDKLGALRDKAYDVGLENKEKALKPDDADGWFALGEQWKELRRKMPRYRVCILKCLEIDPEHARATRVAQDQFEMVKFDGKWQRKEDVDDIQKSKKEEQARIEVANKVRLEKEAKDRERAVTERPALLNGAQIALCSADPKRRDGAIRSLGESIQNTIDPGFGEEGVDILANLNDPAAVFPGLDLAIKNKAAQVRKAAFEALSFRGSIKEDQQIALGVIGDALKTEKEVEPAKAGIEGLVAIGKPGLGPLVASLSNPEAKVRDEIIDALKTATKQTLSTKEAWEDWYLKNK
jgi:hypothetical protein